MASFLEKSGLSYGSVEIFYDEVLGIGSYGKTCKAKCGQLLCAAKLLHFTLFHDSGTGGVTSKFMQECQLFSTMKHSNIVQYLGTTRDPRSGGPVLLMELMDQSLTRLLEASSSPLSYHFQLNICHDVAQALAYLHSNDIIHRDLSSNNVLLIGEGSRAKVNDFGMARLADMNPHLTPLTACPGTPVYMPPETLRTPPLYSQKLDCFSHGVLIIQVLSRQFPNPTEAVQYKRDPSYPSGAVLIPIREIERRKEDIDKVERSHPILPIALNCIKDLDTERPSADEICGILASLKLQPKYTQSLKQTRERILSLQQEIDAKSAELEIETSRHKTGIDQYQREMEHFQKEQVKKLQVHGKKQVPEETMEQLQLKLERMELELMAYRQDVSIISSACCNAN